MYQYITKSIKNTIKSSHHEQFRQGLLFAASLILLGCDLGSHYDPVEKTLYVDYYQEPCSDNSTDLCLRISTEEASSYALTSLPMKGFESLLWGVRYKVKVESDRDGRGKVTSHTLLSIESSEDIAPLISDFVLTLPMSSGILKDNSSDGSGSEWILAGEKTFTCQQGECAAITSALTANQKLQLNFRVENNEIKLQAVKCAASDANFSTECEGIKESSWNIAHFKTDCGLYVPSWCHVYKETSESTEDWKLLPIDIAEFTDNEYQWGIQYDIAVSTVIKAGSLESASYSKDTKENDNTDLNGSRLDSAFKFVVRTGDKLAKSADGVINYLGTELDCDRYNLCYKLNQMIADSDEQILVLEGKVEFSDSRNEPSSEENSELEAGQVVLQKLVCDAKVAQFKADCADQYDDVYWINKH